MTKAEIIKEYERLIRKATREYRETGMVQRDTFAKLRALSKK